MMTQLQIQPQLLPTQNAISNDLSQNLSSPQSCPPTVTAYSWCILDLNEKDETSQLMHSLRPYRTLETASITKMMTCFVCLSLIERYNIDPKTMIFKVSEAGAMLQGTSAELDEGDMFCVLDLLYGMMVPSGNDAALTLAENFGDYLVYESKYNITHVQKLIKEQNKQIEKKNIQLNFNEHDFDSIPQVESSDAVNAFVKEMNAFADKLGLKNSNYANPHGLSNSYNKSTAFDQCKLAKIALKNPLFEQIVKTKSYTCTLKDYRGCSKEISWVTTNKLLHKPNFDGIKTGITQTAGPCLCARFRKWDNFLYKEINLIIVVLKCDQKDDRFHDSYRLIHWAYQQLKNNEKDKRQIHGSDYDFDGSNLELY